jgi:hypothetical protein
MCLSLRDLHLYFSSSPFCFHIRFLDMWHETCVTVSFSFLPSLFILHFFFVSPIPHLLLSGRWALDAHIGFTGKRKLSTNSNVTKNAPLLPDIPYDICEFLAAHGKNFLIHPFFFFVILFFLTSFYPETEPPSIPQPTLLSPVVAKRNREDVNAKDAANKEKQGGLFQRFLHNRRTSESIKDNASLSVTTTTNASSPSSPLQQSFADDDLDSAGSASPPFEAMRSGNKTSRSGSAHGISPDGTRAPNKSLPTPPPLPDHAHATNGVGNGGNVPALPAGSKGAPTAGPAGASSGMPAGPHHIHTASNASKTTVKSGASFASPPSPPRSIKIVMKQKWGAKKE